MRVGHITEKKGISSGKGSGWARNSGQPRRARGRKSRRCRSPHAGSLIPRKEGSRKEWLPILGITKNWGNLRQCLCTLVNWLGPKSLGCHWWSCCEVCVSLEVDSETRINIFERWRNLSHPKHQNRKWSPVEFNIKTILTCKISVRKSNKVLTFPMVIISLLSFF